MKGLISTLAAAALALLAGCATPPVEPGDGGERPPAFGAGGRVVALPTPRQRLVALALQEWTLWGRLRWDAATDTFEWPGDAPAPPQEYRPDFTSRVLLYWQGLRDGAAEPQEAQYADGSLVAWSAVFIGFLMRGAGIGEERFPASALHWHYLHRTATAPDPQGFEALDAAAAAPAVGDLVCAPRDGTARRVTAFAQLATAESRGAYHCDLVVQVGPGELGAIGGNVRDGVTWTRAPLDEAGRLRSTPTRPWIAVLRNHLP